MPPKSQELEKIKWNTDDKSKIIVFYESDKKFSKLANTAADFPVKVNNIEIQTSEALYQAMKIPDRPKEQKKIFKRKRPGGIGKYMKKKYDWWRSDWDEIKVEIMRWCLHVKLAQNWEKFSAVLMETGERTLIEGPPKDDFWGAVKIDKKTREGVNMLGLLLMDLREEIKEEMKKDGAQNSLLSVKPPEIPNFYLDGRLIETIGVEAKKL